MHLALSLFNFYHVEAQSWSATVASGEWINFRDGAGHLDSVLILNCRVGKLDTGHAGSVDGQSIQAGCY